MNELRQFSVNLPSLITSSRAGVNEDCSMGKNILGHNKAKQPTTKDKISTLFPDLSPAVTSIFELLCSELPVLDGEEVIIILEKKYKSRT